MTAFGLRPSSFDQRGREIVSADWQARVELDHAEYVPK
jgi:hypothetical protein